MSETIGIIGGGQLGRMLTEAAVPLGYGVVVLDNSPNCPAAQVGAEQIQAGLANTAAIGELATRSSVLTWEIEHIPAEFLKELANAGANIQPSPNTLAIIQDKLTQKEFLQSHDIPVAPFSAELDESRFRGGGPFVVKSRKGGYDGRGNLVVDSLNDPAIWEHFGDQPVYAEQALEFGKEDKEISVVAAGDKEGAISKYPVVETEHQDNICHLVTSPADINEEVQTQANEIADKILGLLKGAGVLAIEMFVVNGKVMVNEIAPRVHNSGHLTIEASVTSQFEQHIRAITGMPLGETQMRRNAAAMINILGTHEGPLNLEGLNGVLALPDTHPHLYGKSPRPKRKIGHITVLGDSLPEARQTALNARSKLTRV